MSACTRNTLDNNMIRERVSLLPNLVSYCINVRWPALARAQEVKLLIVTNADLSTGSIQTCMMKLQCCTIAPHECSPRLPVGLVVWSNSASG